MKVFAILAAALLTAGAASAMPIPAEGSYIPGPANYGEKVSVQAVEVYLERELNALGLSGSDTVTVTRARSPASVSHQGGR